MKAEQLKNTRLIAKVRPHNMRFPRSGHQPGDFAIVIFDVIKVIEGSIPEECIVSRALVESMYEYQITATGKMPKINNSNEYILQGILTIDKDWGPQYNLEQLRLDYDLTREADQKKFFSYFLTENQVNTLFSDPKNNPIEWLETKNIGALTKLKGIGPATALRMCSRYEECKDNGRAYVALKGLDLTKRAIDRLVERYGSADVVVDKIQTNPYLLIKEVRGYGWIKADAIARKQGFAPDCKERVVAYTQYYLEQQADVNGNSWVSVDDLLAAVFVECSPVAKEDLMAWIKEIMCSGKDFDDYYSKYSKGEAKKSVSEMPLLYYEVETRRIGLLALRIMEKEIARHLQRLRNSQEEKFTYDRAKCERIIKTMEAEQGWDFTSEQLRAIYNILDNNVSILTGPAGSGKTSILAPVTRIFNEYNREIEQCALSGRASSKMSEVTKLKGKTIHRLLSYIPEEERFAYTERHCLSADVVILDETSMVGGELFLSLISAIRSGAKLIMVGDIQQLESIGYANILKDCITSGYIVSNVLSKIHRQAARSGIITQSLRLSGGESIVKNDFTGEEVRGELRDFKLICSYDNTLVQHNIISEFKKLYFQDQIPIDQIQVIVPMRTKGDISCRVLNEIIQNIVNPGTSLKDVVVDYIDGDYKYKVCYKPNDRIIITHNNYHAMTPSGKEVQIFNGNVGYIKELSQDVMTICLTEQGEVLLPKECWQDVQLAYAITVHKKQGDQVPYAIIGFNTSCYNLYSKELLYTAVTRASKYCVMVAQPRALNSAVKISRVRLKQTWLKNDLFLLYLNEQKGGL